jgi:hypothetical protein
MKTPREILLEEHREAESELDAIRRTVVDRACQRAEHRLLALIATGVRLLWNQMFLPSRPAWLSFAAAWVVVATLSLARLESGVAGDSPSSARQTLLDLKPLLEEQAQLRVELLRSGTSLTPMEGPVGEVTHPGPRSDRSDGSSDDGILGDRETQARVRAAGIDDPPVV